MADTFFTFIHSMGFYHLTVGNLIMWVIAFGLMFVAITKGYEPLLLIPIGFGVFIVNLPLTNLMENHQILS